jgi:hypothetical protein
MISRTSSTLVRLAASISCTSVDEPAAMPRQSAQTPQGSGVGPFSQFSARARRRAIVVFPTPRGPVSRIACGTRSVRRAFRSAVVT